MVGLKVAEGNQAVVTPSPKKKDKKLNKQKGANSPAENKAKTPPKPANGTEAKPTTPGKSPNGLRQPTTPGKSPNGKAASKKNKGKGKGQGGQGKDFGKFGNRNAMKEKDDVFTKMVKDKAVKEHLSPAFLKKLDKCIARLPPAGKRFVYWLVHDVKYKIKFLPLIEDVFKLIRESEVLPLPASGVPPLTKSQKRKAKIAKRKLLRGEAPTLPKKEQKKNEKRKIDEVNATEDATVAPDSQKKKKIKKEKLDSSSVEPAESSFSANEGDASAKKKKVKKEKVSSPEPVNASFSANESIVSGSGKKNKKKKKKSLGEASDD